MERYLQSAIDFGNLKINVLTITTLMLCKFSTSVFKFGIMSESIFAWTPQRPPQSWRMKTAMKVQKTFLPTLGEHSVIQGNICFRTTIKVTNIFSLVMQSLLHSAQP